MSRIKKLKKGDLFLLYAGLFITAAIIGFYLIARTANNPPDDQLFAVIIRDNNKVAEIDLHKVEVPQYFTFDDGIRVTIFAEKGSIKFLEADCPDKICIKTGTLTKPGTQAICLPSRTIVKILDD
ncbi:MAG: NusG domain II-containing protein [Syntrophomonas sp.]|nr:NusG domain II-containing protein [Syntrophomonas sp.]